MPLKIVRSNIVDMHADAIVNTANAYPVIGSGVDETIYEAAGRENLLADRIAIGEIPPGQAAITPAHNLNAKFIIHAVSPKWRGGRNFEKMLLKSSYEHIMRLAVENNCNSIAMPLLATGNNHFPRGMSLDLAVEVATKYINNLDDFTVYIVVYDDASFSVARNRYRAIENYIERVQGRYYHSDGMISLNCFDALVTNYSKQCSINLPKHHNTRHDDECVCEELRFDEELVKAPLDLEISTKSDDIWDEFVKEENKESFSDRLFSLINKKGLTDTEVYKKANLDRRLFSKLRKREYTPHKKTIFALVLALELNLDEAIDLLRYAGLAFRPNSTTDLAVQWYLNHKKYNVIELNIFLVDHGEEPLN